MPIGNTHTLFVNLLGAILSLASFSFISVNFGYTNQGMRNSKHLVYFFRMQNSLIRYEKQVIAFCMKKAYEMLQKFTNCMFPVSFYVKLTDTELNNSPRVTHAFSLTYSSVTKCILLESSILRLNFVEKKSLC